MSIDELLGRNVSLAVRRFGSPGAFLAIDTPDASANASAASATPKPSEPSPSRDVLLLPRSEVPEGTQEGDVLDVFVYLDSDDRPVATVRRPKVVLGEVAFLSVTELTRIGAFVDWGLPKELLVPFAEQTCELHPGERYAVGLFIDDTGRLAGTMRVAEMLRGTPDVELDEWIFGEAWRNDRDIGVFVILERSFVGLVPAGEPNELSRGEAGRFRVANILPDGKIELSLRGHAHQEVEGDARKILALVERPGAPKVGDRSSPDDLRRLLGMSKKAFKRAAGRLLKERAVKLDEAGFLQSARR